MSSPRRAVAVSAAVLDALVDLVAPRSCAGCGAATYLLCPGCRLLLASPGFATRPVPCPAGLPPTWAVTTYAGVAREVLIAHKERGRLGLAQPLGSALAAAVRAALPDSEPPVVLVPVPSSRAATRRRGHDPLLRCARAAARELRADGRAVAVLPLLTLGRRVADQSGLAAAARAENLAGAHRVRARRAARVDGAVRLVVVDDLVTTGASLAEAARALRSAGLEPAAAAVVAATARRPRLDPSAGSA